MKNIEPNEMRRTGNTISFDFDYPDELEPIFNYSEITFEYDTGTSSVPDSVAIIPYVGNLVQVAWAYDIDLPVPTIDHRFKIALDEVKEVLSRFYPEIGFEGPGGLDPVSTVEREWNESAASDTAQLFTGGLDSITTYVRHHNESPKLVTIKKRENAYDGQWDQAKELLADFADDNNTSWQSISTNCYYLMDHSHLESQFSESLPTDSWWANIHCGLAYLATCAPFTVAEGIETMYIASTHARSFPYPWGTNPEIVDKILWGPTHCFNDGYDLTRQEKWQEVIDHFEPHGIHIQSCLTPGNCNKSDCKKCARNIVGLALEGVDAEKYGLRISHGHFEDIREKFETGSWGMSVNEQFFWEDIQHHIPEDIASANLPEHSKDFFEWLADADLAKYEK